MQRNLQISVTEPTMSGGVWQLAAFEWLATSVFTHHEIEDSVISRANLQIIEKTDLRVQYDDWLTSMPSVEKMQEQITFFERRNHLDDLMYIRARARGWFALSDDEAATERMLALVNADKIEHMQPLYWVRGGVVMDSNPAGDNDWARMVARESMLRPGTSDNDINPVYRYPAPEAEYESAPDFTVGPIRYRPTQRYSVDWVDWRGLYGSFSYEASPLNDERRERVNRAMASMIDEAMRTSGMNPLVPPVIALPEPGTGLIVPADDRPIRDIIMPLPETRIDPVHPELRRLEREYSSRRVIEALQRRGNAVTRALREEIERDMAARHEVIAAQVLNDAFANGAGAPQDTDTGDGSGPPSVSVQSDSGSTGDNS